MPRGWRESHRSDTGESQRGRPKLPGPWRRRSCDNESSPPPVSPPNSYTYFEQKPSANETTDTADLAKSPTYFDAILNPVPSNSTGTLVNGSSTCSPVHLKSETTPTPHSIDGESVYPSLVSASSSNTSTKATSPSSTKPLSLLPFLGGLPTNGGMAGSVALTSSVPQWMQFLNKQDVGEKLQDMSTGW